MSGKVILIPADTVKPIELAETDFTDAKELSTLIGAAWIEVVHRPWLSWSNLVMIVDEEGRLTGRPRNPRAEVLYPGAIFGDVIICAEELTAEGPDLAPLPRSRESLGLILEVMQSC